MALRGPSGRPKISELSSEVVNVDAAPTQLLLRRMDLLPLLRPKFRM